MSCSQSGNKTHDTAVANAEGVRQTAVAAATTQAAVTAAEITFYKAVLASCKSNLGGSGQEAAISALSRPGPDVR
jgi:hypothetical protein